MGGSILPLQRTACMVIVRTLLDRQDPHSKESRRAGRNLTRQLESNQFAAVSEGVLQEFVGLFPGSLTADLLQVIAPPHLRSLNLQRCHVVVSNEPALSMFQWTLSKCSYLQSLILDGISTAGGFEEIARVIVNGAWQITSISLEGVTQVTDHDIQILLMGLPCLTSVNLSGCSGLTDNVFYLGVGHPQLRSTSKPGSNLVNVNLSGCQRLTNSCIRYLLELCGPKLRNLNVSCTRMDCTVLWYLSGYSLSTAVQLTIQSSQRLQVESKTRLALNQLLQDFKMLRKMLDEIEQDEIVTRQTEPVNASEPDEVETGPVVEAKAMQQEKCTAGSWLSDEAVSRQPAEAVIGEQGALAVDGLCEVTGNCQNEGDGVVGCDDPPQVYACQFLGAFESNIPSRMCEEDRTYEESVIKMGHDNISDHVGRLQRAKNFESCQRHVTEEQKIDARSAKGGDVPTEHGVDTLQVSQTSVTIKGETHDASQLYPIAESIETDFFKEKDAGVGDRQREHGSGSFQKSNFTTGPPHHALTDDGSTRYFFDNNADELECASSQVHTMINLTENTHSASCSIASLSLARDTSTWAPIAKGLPSFDKSTPSDSATACLQPTKCCASVLENAACIPSSINGILTASLKGVDALMEDKPCSTCFSSSSSSDATTQKDTRDASISDNLLHNLRFSSSIPASRNSSSNVEVNVAAANCLIKDAPLVPSLDCTATVNSQTESVLSLGCKCASYDNADLLVTMGPETLIGQDMNMGEIEQGASCIPYASADVRPQRGTTSIGDYTRSANVDLDVDATDPVLARLYEPNLVSLDISGIDFDQMLIDVCLEECFSVNRHLQKLVLSQGGLTDAMLDIISRNNIGELRYVCLFDCHEITNRGLSAFLKSCPKLQHLDIQGLCHVGDHGLSPLFELDDDCQIGVLKLTETCITDVTLKRIARVLGPKLHEIELLWCEDITDTGLQCIAKHCPSIRNMQLRQRSMASETLLMFVDNCQDLGELGLSAISCMSDEVTDTMAQRLKNLQTLDISWNSDLTNQSVSAILSSCPLLHKFLLMGLKQITEKPFLPIIADFSKWRRCHVLIKLKIREQKLRRETGMAQLSSDEEFEDLFVPLRSTSYAPSLRQLNLSFCDHVNDNRLEEIVAICRGTLAITDYYGESIEPKLLHSS